MSGNPWYPRYPADFIAGTLALTLEEKGAYSIVLDLIYDRGGPIDDDPAWLARVCGCSTRRWKTIRLRLIEFGKITAENGRITNKRAEKQIEKRAKEARKLSENGAKGAEKANEKKATSANNNNLGKKGPEKSERHTRSQKLEAREREGPAPEKKDDLCDIPDWLRRDFQGDVTAEQKREKWLLNLKNFMLRKNGGNIQAVQRLFDAFGRGEQWAKTEVERIDAERKAA